MVPRFWGCKLNFRSGKKLDNIANSGNHIVSLLLGARTWAAKFRCFGTDCLWWRSPFSLKLFHERDNGHQVVLSWLSVFEWNCASKLGAITVHLSNFTVNLSNFILIEKPSISGPPNGGYQSWEPKIPVHFQGYWQTFTSPKFQTARIDVSKIFWCLIILIYFF